MRRRSLSALCLAAALGAGTWPVALSAAPQALKGDYGPLKDDFYPFWTRIGKDGQTSWRKAAESALRERGFADSQIAKFVQLKLMPITKDLPGDYTPGKAGIVKLTSSVLPIEFNSETGAPMPFDPKAYAAALPDCYARDERSCTFKYSTQVESIFQNENGAATKAPCMLPQRTIRFCKAGGFVNRNTFKNNETTFAKQFAASCGEADRFNGCGADEVVFDDGAEQTKLAFALDKSQDGASAAAPASTAPASSAAPASASLSPTATPAQPPPSRIAYHGNKFSAFARRDGPAQLEEWEPDMGLVKRVEQAEKKHSSNLTALQALLDKERHRVLVYCWPHDVYKPCDIE